MPDVSIDTDAVIEAIRLKESAAPGTPASGFGKLYEKTDGLVYFKNDAGTEYDLTGGGVTGPGSSTDNAIARFNGTGGDTLQDSGVTITDNNVLTLPDSATYPPLNVTERSTEPSGPASGDIYLDDGTNTASGNPGWRRYTGAAWEDISAASGGTAASGASVYNSADISIADATLTALTFNSEDRDTDGFHSTVTNTGRLTVPAGGDGVYVISGHVAFDPATGWCFAAIRLNGTTQIAQMRFTLAGAGVATIISVSRPYLLSAGDYAELLVYQDSAGAVDVIRIASTSPEFAIERVA